MSEKKLKNKYDFDQRVWDSCAVLYEEQIVGGHPDIVAYEEFEEHFLDQMILHLIMNQTRDIKIIDVGCGSGRLHFRYGSMVRDMIIASQENHVGKSEVLASKIKQVHGIDFSQEMLRLADQKLRGHCLYEQNNLELTFEQGSAFDLQAEENNCFPVVVCLVNSIGVMQGPEGAKKLIESMKRAIDGTDGLAIISCFQKEFLPSFGLNQYESTLSAGGQPVWLTPATYASKEYVQVSREYKRAYDEKPDLPVDVYDTKGKLVKENHLLTRVPGKTSEVLDTGHIETYWGYESNWYSFEQLNEWIRKIWKKNSFHIKTAEIDPQKAKPGQIAVYDTSGLISM
jgi:SAM-dependent methyltransferase